VSPDATFPFVQFEFGFVLGPADGRYLLRSRAEGPPRRVIVLATLGAPQRRLLRGRRGDDVTAAEPEPVPTTRATLVRAEAFDSVEEAERWLGEVRDSRDRAEAELEDAARDLNAVMHAYRLASADPYGPAVSPADALVVRLGYGDGQRVSDGHFAAAWEPPRPRGRRRRRRRMTTPDERFARLVGAREHALAAEDLVLRARADADGGRPREAALQTRIALECLVAELADEPDAETGRRRAELEDARGAIGEAANAALAGDPSDELQERVAEVIARMEAALRHHAHGGG
jgi:hypothetical protein